MSTAKVLFKRIILSNSLLRADLEYIRYVQKSNEYSWHARHLIVSAIIVSLLYQVDEDKIGILVDFVKNNEQNVWQNALVGLVISLWFHNKIDSKLFEPVHDLLEGNSKLIECVRFIVTIMQQELYQPDKVISNMSDKVFENVKEKLVSGSFIFESDFKLCYEEILDALKNQNSTNNSSSEKSLMEDLSILKDRSSFNIKDVIELISKRTYSEIIKGYLLEEKDLLRNEFFKNPVHWFIPFDSELTKDLLYESEELEDSYIYIESLEKSWFLTDSAKYMYVTNLHYIDKCDRDSITSLGSIEEDLKTFLKTFWDRQKVWLDDATIFLNTVRNLYVYNTNFNIAAYRNFFAQRVAYHESYLGKVLLSELELIKEKILTLFRKKKYKKALLHLHAYIEENGFDSEIIYSFFAFQNKKGQSLKALKLFKKCISLLSEEYGKSKLQAYNCLGDLYIGYFENYEEALNSYFAIDEFNNSKGLLELLEQEDLEYKFVIEVYSKIVGCLKLQEQYKRVIPFGLKVIELAKQYGNDNELSYAYLSMATHLYNAQKFVEIPPYIVSSVSLLGAEAELKNKYLNETVIIFSTMVNISLSKDIDSFQFFTKCKDSIPKTISCLEQQYEKLIYCCIYGLKYVKAKKELESKPFEDFLSDLEKYFDSENVQLIDTIKQRLITKFKQLNEEVLKGLNSKCSHFKVKFQSDEMGDFSFLLMHNELRQFAKSLLIEVNAKLINDVYPAIVTTLLREDATDSLSTELRDSSAIRNVERNLYQRTIVSFLSMKSGSIIPVRNA